MALSRKTKRNAVIAGVLGILIGFLLKLGADKQGAPYVPRYDYTHENMRDW